ncbi:MAG: hypothetical protein LBS69_10895 [Prevotellaceae bacterium]|jgi:hypothetical protein|nr:hypothetical protein [Prevotellaceae bacterium]
MEEKNNDIQENKNDSLVRSNVLKDIISGKIFVSSNIQKHLGYIFFIFFLAVFYIGYCYTVENTIRENKKLDKEIKLLRTEYIYQSSELMRTGKKSEIIKQIQERNLTLKEPKNPFIRIKIK